MRICIGIEVGESVRQAEKLKKELIYRMYKCVGEAARDFDPDKIDIAAVIDDGKDEVTFT